MQDTKKSRDGLVRVSLYFTEEGYERLLDVSKETALPQAAMLEAMIRYAPKEVFLEACGKMVEFRKGVREAKKEARKLVANMSPEELAALVKKAG